MPTTTALVAVNRIQKRGRLEPTSTVTDDSGPVLLDFVNEAAREVFETAEWDFLTRNDGQLTVVPRIEYTDALSTSSATVFSVLGQNDYASFYGNFQTRVVVTGDTTYSRTSFAISNAAHPAASDVYTLRDAFPSASGFTLKSGMIYVIDYQLPATVRDVLSVQHEQDEVPVEFVARSVLDRAQPSLSLVVSDSPDVVYVGGSVTSTKTTGGTATTALGLTVWPVPTAAYVLSYSYRYLHPALSAATDTLDAPQAIVDIIVDKAMAKAYRSAVFNDPEMAQQIELDVARRFQRLMSVNSPAPQRRMILRSHDEATGASQFGSRPRDPRTFYTP